ncbi:unnamed protein product [Closterium sp. NIES-54]
MIKNVRDTCVSAITRSTQSIHPLLSVRLPSPSLQLGFSLLEAGTVRFKNTRNIMIKNVLDTCVCAIAFWLLGYGIGFGEGSKVFGWKYDDGSVRMVDKKIPHPHLRPSPPHSSFFLSALIYPVIAHMIWSQGGLLAASQTNTVLNTIGVLDNAGSMVVHVTGESGCCRCCVVAVVVARGIMVGQGKGEQDASLLFPPSVLFLFSACTGGVTSLVGAILVGPRIGRFDIDGKVVPFKCHSVVFIAAGTIILWVGFYGFNGGSVSLVGQPPLQWVQEVARVCVNTTISASFSGVTVWTLTYRRREPVPEDTFNGVIGGLVAACATSSVVEPYAAAIIGVVAGLMYLLGCWLMFRYQIDDPVQAAPTHLFCGSWGGVAAGLFATKDGITATYGVVPSSWGLFYGGGGWQLLVQILALLLVYAWVGTTTYVLFVFLGAFGVLRVKRQEEEVGLDVAFHGGEDEGEEFDMEDSQYGGRRFLSGRSMHHRMPGVLETIVRMLNPKRWGRPGGPAEAFGQKRDVWHRALDNTPYGQFSLAMYEANYVMEDTAEVEGSSSGVYIGVHDGHGGTETSEFLKENLYFNLKAQFMHQGGQVSAEAVRGAFHETETAFTQVVRQSFEASPHLATVGSCSVVAVVTGNALWVANVGDCRAVLGQVRKGDDNSLECRALQLSVDHNLSFASIREKFIEEHADMPDAVVEKRGGFRVKGKVTVTRSFGDLYLKSHEFNREPLFSRFRVPEPFHPPLLSCEPNIAVRLLSPHDSFVILASDGLFEFISNQEAVDIVASSPRKDIARQLIRAALRRAAERREIRYQDLLRMASGQRREYHDDITVVVFFFNHEARNKHATKSNMTWNHDISFKGGKDARLALNAAAAVDLASPSKQGTNEARAALSSASGSLNRTTSSVPEDGVLEMEELPELPAAPPSALPAQRHCSSRQQQALRLYVSRQHSCRSPIQRMIVHDLEKSRELANTSRGDVPAGLRRHGCGIGPAKIEAPVETAAEAESDAVAAAGAAAARRRLRRLRVPRAPALHASDPAAVQGGTRTSTP